MVKPVDNSAGKACAKCEAAKAKDSCTSWIDVDITNSKGKKSSHTLCGAESKTFYIVDKSFGTELVGGASEVTLFAKDNNTFKFKASTDKPTEVSIKIQEKCSKDPDKCPEGLFITPEAIGHKVAKSYNGTLPYYSGESVTFGIDPIEIVTSIFKKIPLSIQAILGNAVSTYHLSVAKRHKGYDEPFKLENGKLYLPENGVHHPVDIQVMPFCEAEIRFKFYDYKSSSSELTKDEQQAIQTADYRVQNPDSTRADKKAQRGYKGIDPILDSTAYKFEVGGKITIGKNEFKYNHEESIENLSKTYRRLTGEKHLAGISEKILGASKGGHPVVYFEVVRPGIECIINCKYNDSGDYISSGYDWKLEANAAPIAGMKITADLIQILAAYFGLSQQVDYIRTMLDNPANSHLNLKLQCDFSVTGKIDTGVVFEKKHNQEKWDIKLNDTTLKIIPTLEIDIKGEIKVWIVSGVFQVQVKVKAEFCFTVRKNAKEDFETVFHHKGATAEVAIEAKASIGNKRNNPATQKNTKSTGAGGKWTVYDPLPIEQGKVLFTL